MQSQLTAEELDTLHEKMMILLKAFAEICEKHHLTYILYGGSLIGAVRHNGFIPWDDDLDVAMPREDYDRFLKIAKDELPEDIFLQTFETDPHTCHYFTKLRLNNTLFLEAATRSLPMHHGIFMDIFPLDKLPESTWKQRFFDIRYSFMHQILTAKCTGYTMCPVDSLQNAVKALIRFSLHIILILVSKKWIFYRYDMLARTYNSSGGKRYISAVSGSRYWQYLSEDELLPTVFHDFEGEKVRIPNGYHAVLTRRFGDYMTPPPIKDRAGHHRPLKIQY